MNLDNYTAGKIIKEFKHKNSEHWRKVEEKTALDLFHAAAKRVPAYKDFLKKHEVNPEKIKTVYDMKSLPIISKKNYLQHYRYEQLLWDGSLNKYLVYSSTSGSTGEPFFFPRDQVLEWESSLLHELYLSQNRKVPQEPTLVVVCFGVGVWIAGLITYDAMSIASQRANYPVSIITPGINKNEIFKILRKLPTYYKQVIMVGYAPFIKDVLDESASHGIDFKKINLRILCAAEPFSEVFRDYLVNSAKIGSRFLDVSNIYGTAYLGTMAIETPLSILIRSLAVKDPGLFKEIFKDIVKTPTFAQYNPYAIMFEEVGGELILSSNSSIPLIRYAIGDSGGVLRFSEVKNKVESLGYNINKEILKNKIQHFVYNLPFVYVYERVDSSTTLYGLQVYREYIKEALIESPASKYVTGKFTMHTKFDSKHNQFLEINIELKNKIKLNNPQKKNILNKIVEKMQAKSSEFRELLRFLKDRSKPRLVFWPAGHELYFKPGT